MKKHYESMFILDLQGKEEGVEEMVTAIKKAIEGLGGEFYAAQRMDRRKFEQVAGKLDAGYYLGVRFDLDSLQLAALRQSFALDKRVFRQVDLIAKVAKEAQAA
ncbi:MAG: 30S ribosomal protein S6 [Blastochloris sp.]|nr:30S ribosomal protein S6 [Blastochloris sp.]